MHYIWLFVSINMAIFEHNIRQMNLTFLSGAKESGVLLTKDYELISPNLGSPNIIFALEIAKKKFNADAVYFRYFEDGRAFVPQFYLFDFTNKSLSIEDKKRIQINMWNGGQAPAYIIIEKDTISIYDSREKPSIKESAHISEILKLTSDIFNTFNTDKFANGLFWEEYGKAHFDFEQSATKDLISGLKRVYSDFQLKSGLDKHIALRLLVQCLLIKYLEERDEKIQNGYFANTYFQQHFQCNNFCSVIRHGKLLDLLDLLAADFNGKIFEWDKNNSIDREAIKKTEVKELANYLDANIKNNQYVLWPLYSFSHLPVEVISSVYEELLTDSKDIVYTPEMIVSTLVDECMPLSNPQKNFKLIDVSCGSGIFLVKAYKRLVQWWRYEQWLKTGVLKKPSLRVLKELIINNIYGIDIEQDAVNLSIFSIALAMLDEVDLDPPTWQQLLFPNLEQNIIHENFFHYIAHPHVAKFDLVIGNPPFNLPFENGVEPNRTKYFHDLKNHTGYKSYIKIPDENPALHFLASSFSLLKPDGILCMIQPSAPLLYKQNTTFKKELFNRYNLLQVIDFTKLADRLWGRKNVPTVAVFVQKSTPTREPVLHLIAERTYSNKNKLFLEFDHYDFHKIDKELAINTAYVWKASLLGGGRIANIISRFDRMRTIGEYIQEKASYGWVKGQGFIEGSIDPQMADYITGHDFLPTEAFTEDGIDISQIVPCQTVLFRRPRKKDIYTAPHLLFRKIIGNNGLIVEYSDKYLTFKSDIVAIHVPEEHSDELLLISDYIKNNSAFLRFYILATSSRVGILKATSLYDEDLCNIPYPANIKEAELTYAEKIIISDTIKYRLKIGDDELYYNMASIDDIRIYSDIFCKCLNSIYLTPSKEFYLESIIDAQSYFVVKFIYKTHHTTNANVETVDNLQEAINNIMSASCYTNTTHFQKMIKFYGNDTIIFIKPKQLKYWIRSNAIIDADEVVTDYINPTYNHVQGRCQ